MMKGGARTMYNLLIRVMLVALAGTTLPMTVAAQSSVGLNPNYRRAQTMVNDGNAAAGRALVDSMIGAAGPGTSEYAEGVYWRAVLAATAAEAEMDYRRIVVEYPLSPRVEDALLRLAQLEMSRANYDGALRHLDRLVQEHPNGTSRSRAGYWMARVLFEKNDIQRACVASADALSRTNENDAELRNQITYLHQRCAGVVMAPEAIVQPAAQPVAKVPVPVVPVDTVVEQPQATPRDVAPSQVEPIIPAPRPAATNSGASGSANGFTVQVAAYNVKSQAEAMAAKLKKGGYEARVSGTKAPFRVRIGRYPTQAQAAAIQRSLKAKQITGIVVQAEAR